STSPIPRIVETVRSKGPEALLIDDIDIFGDYASRLLREISGLRKSPLTIAAIRSSRLQGLDLSADLADLKTLELTVPNLCGLDIVGLQRQRWNGIRIIL